MRRVNLVLSCLLIASFLLAACQAPLPTPTLQPTAAPVEATATPAPPPTPPPDTLYLALVWHQHQPLYYKDAATNVYTRPWVRVHATKDYYDMAAMLKDYPNVHATFNLTPVLMRQLDDIAAGARDQYWVLAEKPAAELSVDDKRYILQRFFDANHDHIIGRFPRYQELLAKRGGAEPEQIDAALASFSEQDFRDLQVWFNLAWFDPGFLTQEPLKALVEQGRGFAEADKQVLFAKALEVVKSVIPLHKEMQDAGQIEVITTPYAHPILPLLYDTNLAKVGNPGAVMPNRFSYPNDAIAQVKKSIEVYQAHFGRPPRGMWPGEGAVAQEIVKMVADAGYTWMASGEPVLAKSLGLDGFSRDSADTVQEADELYRPYTVSDTSGAQVSMIFRDWTISDKVGFTYSGMPGEAAAADVMKRLENIRAQLKSSGAAGPHLVSIILDGENAWENYDNDGKAFLNALYQKLSESPTVKTVTPSEYLEMFPQQQVLPNPLFQGAWFSANYDTWIGEDEEAVAWNHLVKTRQTLAAYDIAQTKTTTPEKLAQALDFMYLAEGSDWFWWYGADQDSGNDDYFDYGFRALLGEVYKALDEPAPDFVQAPIIPKRVAVPARQPAGPFTPVIDGRETAPDEWARAGVYHVVGGALYCGLDAKNLYVRADAKGQWTDLRDVTLGLYVRVPGVPGVNAFSRASAAAEAKTVLGIGATHLVEVDLTAETPALYTASGALGAWKEAKGDVSAAVDGGVLELALPLELLGQLQPGDDLRLVAVTTCAGRDLDLLPAAGPAQLVVPDLGTTTALITVDDPQGDDNGPGSYTYPTDGVFEAGVFDITQFTAGYDAKNVVFKVSFNGPLPNPWGSGNNLSLQTLDIYVDKDPGAATGNRLLLPGRNAALEKGNGWDVMVWAEGWTPGIYAPDAKGTPQKVGYEPKIIVDPAARMVTLRVPREAFGSGFDPAKAGYAAVVMSQDGYPAAGVWRVRDVEAKAAQWRLGGAPADTNHTRIIDVAWPEGARPAQAEFLASYPASQEANMDKLTPDDFCQVPLLTAQGPQT